MAFLVLRFWCHLTRLSPQAANPGCVLEDFVRWYSPRDYIEEEEEGGTPVMKGRLSARMMIPGNMWVEAWETARVTPARRQKRLFDDTREAEKVKASLKLRKPLRLMNVSSSGAALPGPAETCRPGSPSAALRPPGCGRQAEGGRWSFPSCRTFYTLLLLSSSKAPPLCQSRQKTSRQSGRAFNRLQVKPASCCTPSTRTTAS